MSCLLPSALCFACCCCCCIFFPAVVFRCAFGLLMLTVNYVLIVIKGLSLLTHSPFSQAGHKGMCVCVCVQDNSCTMCVCVCERVECMQTIKSNWDKLQQSEREDGERNRSCLSTWTKLHIYARVCVCVCVPVCECV